MEVRETEERRRGSQANCSLQSPQRQSQPDPPIPRGSCRGDLTPLSFTLSKKGRRGFPALSLPHSVVKDYPREMEISRHFRPFEVQEKSKDSPPRVEGSRSTLKLVGAAEPQAEEVQGFQGDMVSVWILSPTVSEMSFVTSS